MGSSPLVMERPETLPHRVEQNTAGPNTRNPDAVFTLSQGEEETSCPHLGNCRRPSSRLDAPADSSA